MISSFMMTVSIKISKQSAFMRHTKENIILHTLLFSVYLMFIEVGKNLNIIDG